MNANPDVKRTWVEWIYESNVPLIELVIETDLEMRPDHPNFDEMRFNRLVESAVLANGTGAYARVRVLPTNKHR